MMTTVKVISNPYKHDVVFDIYNSTTEEWKRVNYQDNSSSKLITEEIQKSFFPHKVNRILSILTEEYASGDDGLQIVFEGTSDEYEELVGASQGIDNITIQRANIGIENARDILPRIIDVFSEVQPIVEDNISSETTRKKIEQDIAKFIDASNDIVPICVLGNYSSGKSTFINALIGLEILQSGDLPVTAKVYKIKQSTQEDEALIDFEYGDKTISITISEKDFSVECDEDNALTTDLTEVLQSNSEESLEKRVNLCLEVIHERRDGVSDLVNIDIPFAEGPLKDTKNAFVIFDTPGDNTATNRDHYVILEDAMRNLSNGIPIYVAEYNSLDTCDNKSLYEKIKSISQIDSRFTMIVVNKADSANIKTPEFDSLMEETIMNQAVPRNLYSGGIYFISSIMGLGSKNGGKFIDDHMEEFYEDNEKKYEDISSKRYKTLYRYNIMPEQIKHSVVKASEAATNKIYANSGLLAIEHEIVNFAEKYSAYDKCAQSNKYIETIIQASQEEIEKVKTIRKAQKKELENELEEDKRALINSMELKSTELTKNYIEKYNDNLNPYHNKARFSYTNDQMKTLEQKLLMDNREEHKYAEKKEQTKTSRDAVLDNISQIGRKGFSEFVLDMGEDIKNVLGSTQELLDLKVQIDKETADELIELITNDFNERLDESIKLVTSASRKYWEDNAESIKKEQLMIVAESETLDDEKKKELSEIITSYGTVKFKDEQEFEKAEFEIKLHLLWKTVDLNKINTKKLTEKYNVDYDEKIGLATGKIREYHSNSFERWRSRLVKKIRDNIIEYSPKLTEQAAKIDDETRKIEQLEDTINQLENYSKQVDALMDWRIVV